MKKLIAMILLSCAQMVAQGIAYHDIAVKATGLPAASSSIRVCKEPAIGTPCVPLAAIYTDQVLSNPKGNPFNGDTNGNFGFYGAKGWYHIQVSGTGVTTYDLPYVWLGNTGILNVNEYGANGDGRTLSDGAITSGNNSFSSATAGFVASDIGKVIRITGAGPAASSLGTTIASVSSSTTVILSLAASATVSGASFTYGSDNVTTLPAAIATASSLGATIVTPPGIYMSSSSSNTSSSNVVENVFGTVLVGNGGQALQTGITTVVPQGISIQHGTSASPTTGLYVTKPSLYISRYDATDASACITGLTDGCMAAIFRIDGVNKSTTTSSTMTGMLVNLWGARAASGASTYGNAYIGGGFQVWDTDGALNRVNLFGINPNVGAVFVPTGCWKGIVGQITCARTVLGAEIDVTNPTVTDGVFHQSIGNNFQGLSISCFPTNATPKNCTTGLSLGTGTVDHGFWIGADFGSSVQTALLISQTALNFKPEIAIHVASQGSYGIVIGTGSTTYTHSIANTFTNPAIGVLLDASRLEGATGTANSNNVQWRAANAATTYWNVRQYLGSDGFFHWQEDNGTSTVGSPAALADFMSWQPATALTVTGSVAATQALLFKAGPVNFFQINGTPTGGRIISVQDATQTLVGRDTTDTLTNKTLTAPTITAPSITGIGSSGKAMCWKTASTLGFCSTVVDAAGACTCN